MIITYSHIIDGVEVTAPKGWEKNVISVDFRKQDSLTALSSNVSVDLGTLIFTNDGAIGGLPKSAQYIIDHVEGGFGGGTNGLFEDLSYQIKFQFAGLEYTMFDGYLDMDTYLKNSPVNVTIEAKPFQDINALVTKAKANSFGYLENIKFITKADYVSIPFIVQSQEDGALLLAAIAVLTLLSIQLAQVLKTFADDVATATSLIATGLTGSAASLIYLAFSVITQGFLILILSIQIVRILNDIKEIVLPSLRYHKSMYLYDLLDKAVTFLGFNLVSPIELLKQVVYLPSKPTNLIDVKKGIVLTNNPDPEILVGIPKPDDYGYYLSDFFKLIETVFNARFRIIGNEMHVRSKKDPYWLNTSNFKAVGVGDKDISKLDLKSEERSYNIQDYKANNLISFATDPADRWTLNYFSGTNYEVIERVISPKNTKLARKGGLREISISLALGNRKSELRTVEKVVGELFSSINQLANKKLLGIKPLFFLKKLVPKISISERIGALMTSGKTHSVAKLIYFVNGRIPADHRDKWSAKILWDNGYNYESFIENDFGGQKLIIVDEIIPFGPIEFAKVLDNNFYTRPDGELSEMLRLRWTPDGDIAIIDSAVPEVYMDKLEQIKIQA